MKLNERQEMVLKIFKGMTELIEKRGTQNKMVTIPQITAYIKVNQGVKPAINALIRKKYVRYYRVNGLYYYGITKLGWQRWIRYQLKDTQNTECVPGIDNVDNNKVNCPICGKLFNKRGLPRHLTACRKKQIA